MPTPRRFSPALVPAAVAAAAGVGRLADLPLGEERCAGHPPDDAAFLVGHEQQRRADRVQRARVRAARARR